MQASACGALLPLVKYAATGSIDALLSVGILPLLVRLLLFQTDKHPSQITIYACLVLAQVCDQRGKDTIDQIRAASTVAADDEWMFLHAVTTMLKASLVEDDNGRKLSCALSTLLLCLMSLDRTVTQVMQELGAIPTVSSAMVRYANDAGTFAYVMTLDTDSVTSFELFLTTGIVKYSDTVCQQLAKASSPKKGKQVASSAKGTKARKGGAKARPAEGVVYNLQLPSVASPPSKRVQAQMTPTYGTNESKVLSTNAFAASKPPGESNPRTTTTTRVRPSPSDPNLPSLESLQSSDMKSTAKRPSRPTRQTGSSPPKRPANPPKAAFP
ncbi:hypothetical protein AaE_005237, partial [Aphanomyces astaci]